MRSIRVKDLFPAVLLFFLGQNAFAATADSQDTPPVAASTSSADQSASSKDSQGSLSVTADAMPSQVAMVSGDYHKFEALNWQNRGYSGGIEALSVHYKPENDVTIDAESSGIMGNGDYKGSCEIAKEDAGYLKLDFKQFRKYYDTYGGVYNNLPISSDSLSRDLFLDIGHFGLEAGITPPDLPHVSVYYDLDYKRGSKSTLDWYTVTVGSVQKKISPSWEEIHEITNTFGIKADHTLDGYHLTGDQRWEITEEKTHDYEVGLSNVGGANTDERRQDDVLASDVMTSTLGVDKWYWGDKVYGSSAFRLEHLKSQENQDVEEFTAAGFPAPGTLPNLLAYNKPNGTAHSTEDLSSWVLNMMVSPWSWLSGSGGFKAEVSQMDANSYTPTDTLAPIGVIDYTTMDNTKSNTYKFAESFGLRFKAIPRTAIYSELSFEQSQNHLMENQTAIAGTTTGAGLNSIYMTRDAIINEPTATWTTGADFQPLRFINLTSQFRLQDKGMDFDDRFRVDPAGGLVFLENLHTETAEFNQRATLYLCGWAQTSIRYLFDDTDYTTRAAYDTADEKANMLSNTFIYDVSVFPLPNLSMTGSFTQRQDQTKTVAASSSTFLIPAFTSNYDTWMFHTDYQPHKNISVTSSLFYTIANNGSNFTDYNQSQLVYYGADYNQLGFSVGCKWKVRRDLTVQPKYTLSRYMPSENSGSGAAYDAHILSVSLSVKWG